MNSPKVSSGNSNKESHPTQKNFNHSGGLHTNNQSGAMNPNPADDPISLSPNNNAHISLGNPTDPSAVQLSSDQQMIRREPDPDAKTPIIVPEIDDPEAIESVHFDYSFQWQNPILRETTLQKREESLKAFLLSQRELEIDGLFESAKPFKEPELRKWLIDHRAHMEKSLESLQAELIPADELVGFSKVIVDQYEQELLQEKAANKKELEAVGGREIIEKRKKLEEALQKQINGPGNHPPEKVLAYIEKHRRKMTDEKYEEAFRLFSIRLDQKQGEILRLQNEIELNEEAYRTVVYPIIKEEDRINKELDNAKINVEKAIEQRRQLKQDIKGLKWQIKATPKINPSRELSDRLITRWERERYKMELDKKTHDELVSEINQLFAADTDLSRFPKWIRYGIMHYSGINYEEAHYGWHDPRKLLEALKEEQMSSLTPGQERLFKSKALYELESGAMEVPKKVKSEFDQYENLKLRNKPAFEQIIHFEDELTELHMQLIEVLENPATAEKIIRDIGLLENEIEQLKSGLSGSEREQIDKAYANRDKGLLAVYLASTKKKIAGLSEEQALFLLQQMKDEGQIPDFVWKEIIAFTSLRANITDTDWQIDRSERALNWYKPEQAEKKAEKERWKRIMNAGFSKSMDDWRSHHKETVAPNILIQMKCDALGSNIQHARNVPQPGGLTANATQYFEDSKVNPATTFKRLESIDDLRQGASLFYLGWKGVEPNEEKNGLEATIERLEKLEKKRQARGKDLFKNERKQLNESRKNLAGLANHSDFLPELNDPPGRWQMFFPFSGHEVHFDEKVFKDELIGKDGWKYSVFRKGEQMTIIRMKPNPFYNLSGLPSDQWKFDGTLRKEMMVEWMRWTHQVTVMYVSKEKGKVHALDTWASTTGPGKFGALGTSILRFEDLMARGNVFVGYSDSPSDHPNVDQNLEGLEMNYSPVPQAD